jgi:hypothetical protein
MLVTPLNSGIEARGVVQTSTVTKSEGISTSDEPPVLVCHQTDSLLHASGVVAVEDDQERSTCNAVVVTAEERETGARHQPCKL